MSEAEVISMQKKFVKAMGGAWFDGVRENEKGTTNPKNTKGLPGRLAETLQATRDSTSLKEVAKARGLTFSTIVTHLEELNKIGKLSRADFSHLVPIDILDEIHEAFRDTESDKLSPVFHALGGRHSFETIRLVRLMRQ